MDEAGDGRILRRCVRAAAFPGRDPGQGGPPRPFQRGAAQPIWLCLSRLRGAGDGRYGAAGKLGPLGGPAALGRSLPMQGVPLGMLPYIYERNSAVPFGAGAGNGRGWGPSLAPISSGRLRQPPSPARVPACGHSGRRPRGPGGWPGRTGGGYSAPRARRGRSSRAA